MAANIAGNDMQIVVQVPDKRGVGPCAKSVGMQKMGLGPWPTPVQIMYSSIRGIQIVFCRFYGFRCIHNKKEVTAKTITP
jgi:hypothetical protein